MPPLPHVNTPLTRCTRAVLSIINNHQQNKKSRFYGQDVVGIVHTIRVISIKTGQILNFYDKFEYCTVFKYTKV